MKPIKQVLSGILAAVTLFTVPAYAAVDDTGFSDVASNAWYAEAVEYVHGNGLMSGTSATTFSPETNTSRAMLATILYRSSGSPAVTEAVDFTDVSTDAYYADAVAWASANGIISGYGNGLFGPNDPITREQIAAILWRYAGSPSAETGADFADESSISSYAATAVDWARASGIVNGAENNQFLPQDNATRAEVATILYNYMTREQGSEQVPDAAGDDVLVVYFSGSGNTEEVAETISDTLGAELFELIPEDPYTEDDLNWTDEGSRVNREHEDEALRDVQLAEDTVSNWEDYDTVLIGYPIWWGTAAWPVNDFVESNDFSGKNVIPFCTSTSSGLGESAELLEELAGTGNWLEGRRFSERPAQSDIQSWLNNFDI